MFEAVAGSGSKVSESTFPLPTRGPHWTFKSLESVHARANVFKIAFAEDLCFRLFWNMEQRVKTLVFPQRTNHEAYSGRGALEILDALCFGGFEKKCLLIWKFDWYRTYMNVLVF